MNDVLKKIGMIGVAPVVKIDDAKDAVPLAKALCEGGLPYTEVAFHTDAAGETVRAAARACPEMLVDTGTVLMAGQIGKAVVTGATFIVSPGLNLKVVKYCMERGILITPGVSDTNDIEQAIELNLDVVEFFPAGWAGGFVMIKALTAPYVKMGFVPIGGINAKNLNEYLAYNKILACDGSWMVKSELIGADEFGKIRDTTREAAQTMLGFGLGHIGISTKDAAETGELADAFSDILGLAREEGSNSFLAGIIIETMKYKGSGDRGHFSISTNSLPRVISYFESRGIEFDPDSAKYGDKGNIAIIRFRRDFCGFRVHLTQRK